MDVLSMEAVRGYGAFLREEEKSRATVEKYMRDIRSFYDFLPKDKAVNKERVISYKESLLKNYQVSSANSMLVAINGLLTHLGWDSYRVKIFKFQRKLVCEPERELKRQEYVKLVETADRKGKERLSLIMQTICATGIRIGELSYITREAVMRGRVTVRLKGKNRVVMIPAKLKGKLVRFCRMKEIKAGPVFVTSTGRQMDRSNIWSEMKKICREAGVDETKVFPHNLRHLFARTYYKKNKDIAYLADILGHSNVNTTRIYTCISSEEHERTMSELDLVI